MLISPNLVDIEDSDGQEQWHWHGHDQPQQDYGAGGAHQALEADQDLRNQETIKTKFRGTCNSSSKANFIEYLQYGNHSSMKNLPKKRDFRQN